MPASTNCAIPPHRRLADQSGKSGTCRSPGFGLGLGGTLLVLYERGIVCLESDGWVRWHVLHDDLSAGIVTVGVGGVVLRQQCRRNLLAGSAVIP